MKWKLLQLLTFFWLAFEVSNAVISPEAYWKERLPTTPIPQVIKDVLSHTRDDTKEIGKVYSGLYELFGVFAWAHAATEDSLRELNKNKISAKGNMHYGIHQQFVVHHGDTKDEVSELEKEISNKNHAKTGNELQQESEERSDNYLYMAYFFENYLKKGKVINFPPLKNKNEAPLLPRQLVESIPFSSEKLPEILTLFSIDGGSKDAQVIEKTIKTCEEPPLIIEKKMCATSLESMVDYAISLLGTNNIKAVATEVEGKNQMLQKYKIEDVQQLADGDNMVCHKVNYAYAVHFCHVGGRTKTFMVSMIGDDGTKVNAVSVCHEDTSFWNPKALPFVYLKVKPGDTPICHFLHDDQIVFIPSQTSN